MDPQQAAGVHQWIPKMDEENPTHMDDFGGCPYFDIVVTIVNG